MSEIIEIMQKKPHLRTPAELKKLLPFVMKIDFFKMGTSNEQMDIEDYQLIAENMKFKHFDQGETIFKNGDFGNEFFIILKREVKVLVPKKN
jgi:CRP-like cAMP-binding protein